MTQQLTELVAADLAPAIDAIATAAKRVAAQRAKQVAQVSGGAVETTPEQLTAIEARAVDELSAELRTQLRDVATVYITSITE
jgi:hypothetical protein